jgi:S-adenosylmethionine decarboxylase
MPRAGRAIQRACIGQISTRSAAYLAAALAPRSFPMPTYTPGLHILATFAAPPTALRDAESCRAFFDAQVRAFGLEKVGEAYHSFPADETGASGFTAVLALTESHLSIHTWPEHGLATFDVFLSNFRRDNAATVRGIYAATLAFFEGTELTKTEVRR